MTYRSPESDADQAPSANQAFSSDTYGDLTSQPEIQLEPWQYRITTTPHPGAQRHGDIWLSHAADLPVTEVRDANGTSAGLLLGFPIDLAGNTIPNGVWQLPDGADLATSKGITTALTALGGRFLWLCQTATYNRIYPDAATQISCVWDRETKSAGSTALAILDDADYAARFDHAQFATLGGDRETWLTAGLTAHSGVTRLLPNHFLDLDTWTVDRINLAQITLPQRPDDIVDAMIGIVTAQIGMLVAHDKVPLIGLTGGMDSRVILACARQWADDLCFVTVASEDASHQDALIAQRIGREMRLRHRVLPRLVADRTEQERYLRRSGHCSADSNLQFHPTVAGLSPDHVFVGGIGGDLARAPYRDEDADPHQPVTPNLLLSRIGLPHTEKTLRYLSWWLSRLPEVSTAEVLDLAFLELRIGPWAMAQFCSSPGLVRYAPQLTYQSVAMMRSLPMDWKTTNALSLAIVGRLWPELLALPVNTRGRIWPAPDGLGTAHQATRRSRAG